MDTSPNFSTLKLVYNARNETRLIKAAIEELRITDIETIGMSEYGEELRPYIIDEEGDKIYLYKKVTFEPKDNVDEDIMLNIQDPLYFAVEDAKKRGKALKIFFEKKEGAPMSLTVDPITVAELILNLIRLISALTTDRGRVVYKNRIFGYELEGKIRKFHWVWVADITDIATGISANSGHQQGRSGAIKQGAEKLAQKLKAAGIIS